MIFSALRGSFFLTLMLIVSVTLSGCSFDIGSIVSGLGNVIGNISGNIGGFIEKGLDFAGNFMGKAQEFLGPVMEVGQSITEKFGPIAEKITGGIEKVQGVIEKVSDVGRAVSDFSQNFVQSGVDALGNALPSNVPVSEVVYDPDNEDITVRPDNQQVTETAQNAANELITTEEREQATEEVVLHVNQMNAAISDLTSQLRNAQLSAEQRAALQSQISNIRSSMSQIVKDPTSSASRALLKKAQADVKAVTSVAKAYANTAKATFEAVKSVGSAFGNAAKSVKDTAKNIFKSLF